MFSRNRVFVENLVGLGFLVVCFLYKTIPTHEHLFPAVGKSGANATLSIYFFLRWVGLGLGSLSVSK